MIDVILFSALKNVFLLILTIWQGLTLCTDLGCRVWKWAQELCRWLRMEISLITSLLFSRKKVVIFFDLNETKKKKSAALSTPLQMIAIIEVEWICRFLDWSGTYWIRTPSLAFSRSAERLHPKWCNPVRKKLALLALTHAQRLFRLSVTSENIPAEQHVFFSSGRPFRSLPLLAPSGNGSWNEEAQWAPRDAVVGLSSLPWTGPIVNGFLPSFFPTPAPDRLMIQLLPRCPAPVSLNYTSTENSWTFGQSQWLKLLARRDIMIYYTIRWFQPSMCKGKWKRMLEL